MIGIFQIHHKLTDKRTRIIRIISDVQLQECQTPRRRQTGNVGLEEDSQLGIIRTCRRIEIETVLLVQPEAELEIKSNGDTDISIHFQPESGHANVKINRILAGVHQGDGLAQSQINHQPCFTVQHHGELMITQ